jgi:hypothetical protein
MITELFVENQPVDISNEIDALMTFCIDDIKDFSSRNTSFSKTIIIPGTSKNNKVFGNIFELSSGTLTNDDSPNVNYNYNIAKSARCIMFQGNLQVFKGIIRILQIVIDHNHIEYECAVFGELGSFVSALGASRLEDLDFSDYDHIYSGANISASWPNANGGSGYYYPMIASGYGQWYYKNFRPALFVKEYIEKIFDAAGYAYDFALLDTDRLKRMIVPYNRKTLSRNSRVALDVRANKQTLNSGAVVGGITTYEKAIAYANKVALGSFTASGLNTLFTWSGGANLIGSLTFRAAGTFTKALVEGYFFSLELRVNGTPILTQTFGENQASGSFNVVLSAPNITLTSGDQISVNIVGEAELGNQWQVILSKPPVFGSPYNQIYIESTVPQDVPINLNEDIKINECLPKNILQKDFITSVMKMFNLYLYEDRDRDNFLIVKPFIDYYGINPNEALDWTYKLDRSKPMVIKPMSEINARYYNFKYKADGDYFNETYNKRYNLSYGSYIFDTLFEFSNESKSFEVIFAGTPIYSTVGDDKVYPGIYKYNANVYEPIDSNIRILQAKYISDVDEWTLSGDTSNPLSLDFTSYPYAGHFDDPITPADDLNFGVPYELFYSNITGGDPSVNQFSVYWLPYMYEVIDKDSRLLTATFRLNEQDIRQLDFSKLIYIDGILYRLNKIVDYNASQRDVCKVELLKVIQLTYTEIPAPEGDCIITESNECILTEDSDTLTIE